MLGSLASAAVLDPVSEALLVGEAVAEPGISGGFARSGEEGAGVEAEERVETDDDEAVATVAVKLGPSGPELEPALGPIVAGAVIGRDEARL